MNVQAMVGELEEQCTWLRTRCVRLASDLADVTQKATALAEQTVKQAQEIERLKSVAPLMRAKRRRAA